MAYPIVVTGEPASPPPDDAPSATPRQVFPAPPAVATPPGAPAPSVPSTTSPDGEDGFGAAWLPQGPGPTLDGEIENVTPNNEVVGAVHTVAAHPIDPDILYIGAVNGGIWKTTNATAANPVWTPQTDAQESLSIGALEFDPTDVTDQTLVAGIGRYSSYRQSGGALVGFLRTTDGGNRWSVVNGDGSMRGRNVSGVAPRDTTIVASVNHADAFRCENIGIFRSDDDGATFAQVTAGIPAGAAPDLAGDPADIDIMYAGIVFADICSPGGSGNGVYKSTDGGATWDKVSDAAMDELITDGTTSNIEIAVGTSDNVYVNVIELGQAVGIFRSSDGGVTWTAMDLPETPEFDGDETAGLNPRLKGNGSPAGQGAIHASIRADPLAADIVYVGGDRQDGDLFGPEGNFIGAGGFSGRLFRGDASVVATGAIPSPQWEHLTHRNDIAAIPGGGTASSSAPHADSREMVFDANADLIEVDDGGVYRRTSPMDNTGDWVSINGNLQVTEMHDVAYDTMSNIIISGNQDTGTTQQTITGSTTWDSVSVADGGDVAVDDRSLADRGESIRYSSFQDLDRFRRRTYDASNALVSEEFPFLFPIGDSPDFSAQFVTPIVVNAVDPIRLLFAGDNGLFESFDQGDSIEQISDFIVVDGFFGKPLVYGGVSEGISNADVVYAATDNRVFVRRAADTGFAETRSPFSGGNVMDIALDSNDWMSAYVVDSSNVFVTDNAGETWTELTGNLAELNSELRTTEFIPGSPSAIVVGGRAGISRLLLQPAGTWHRFGTHLANAPVWDLDYDATDDVLVAGTLGRGAWLLTPVAEAGPQLAGDFNTDGCVDTGDLAIILAEIRSDSGDLLFDINSDGALNIADSRFLATLFTNPRGMPCVEDERTG